MRRAEQLNSSRGVFGLVCEVEDVRTNSAVCLLYSAPSVRCQTRTLRNFTFYWAEKNEVGPMLHFKPKTHNIE